MEENFWQFLIKEQGIDPSASFLLTVSGGIDSMVMLHLFHKNNLNISIAHCNFQLRGEESDKDQALVESIAHQLNIPVFVRKFDTKKHATENKISTQMAARELRYSWFDTLLHQHGIDFICTAHHKDDLAETMLFNLSKGTGLAGMRGFLFRNNSTIRPLFP
ncbi:MAG: tRNA lysidine(34) synthetase TilS, partial [Cyclobacteriaceae bacterium]|nr:tRNA lysidine(34) synthetase TilS [Cyclobacteriaceae bacterium]